MSHTKKTADASALHQQALDKLTALRTELREQALALDQLPIDRGTHGDVRRLYGRADAELESAGAFLQQAKTLAQAADESTVSE